MLGDNTDASWEALGRSDPYYGVLTHERYRNANLDEQARREFFRSGSSHMTQLIRRIEALLGPVARGKALDFGCGVGRLVLPLADEAGFAAVTGMDISESMLREARLNAQRRGLLNVEFVLSDDSLSRLQGGFDFVHTFIVLQHIPVARGGLLVRHLIGQLAPGGVVALQLPFFRQIGTPRALANYLRVWIKPLQIVGNLLKGRPWNEPPMQMNRYDMNSVLRIFCDCGLPQVTAEFVDDGGNIGAYLIARRPG